MCFFVNDNFGSSDRLEPIPALLKRGAQISGQSYIGGNLWELSRVKTYTDSKGPLAGPYRMERLPQGHVFGQMPGRVKILKVVQTVRLPPKDVAATVADISGVTRRSKDVG
jgi:hypothetical protein